MDRFPQPIAYRSPGVAEEISVSCAIHASSDAVPNVVGRSSYRGVQPGAPYDSHSGLFFRQQWNRARAADPAVIFVNSWNEWVAGKHILTSNPSIGCQAPECPVSCDDIQSGHCVGGSRYAEGRWLSPGEPFFVDEYTPEFSRDCEPVTGGFEDAYYYQLVNAVRRYKGVRRIGTPSASQSITIDGLFAEWGAVQPEYRDAVGDVMHRNWPSVSPAIVYNDSTGRNDIVVCKVARDSSNVYFYVRAQTALSQSTDSNWMLLFLNVDGSYDTGWNGYDYLVNRSVGSQTIADLSIWTPSGWTSVGSVSYRAASNELEIAIPRSALGLSPSDALRIDFKWADNIQSLTDVREFVLHGDSAPDRRFNYRYAEAAAFPGRTIVVDDDYHVESGAYQYPANELGSALMPYNTFAEGYAQAQPGDRMVVLPNTFSVGNRLDRPVRIESAGGRLLRLQP